MEKPDKPLKTGLTENIGFLAQKLKFLDFPADFTNYAAELGQETSEITWLGSKLFPKKNAANNSAFLALKSIFCGFLENSTNFMHVLVVKLVGLNPQFVDKVHRISSS